MRGRAAVLLLTVAAGCVTDQAISRSFHRFEGGPITAITAKLGAPSSNTVVQGARWYAWDWKDQACRLSARVDDGGTVLESSATGTAFGCEQLYAAIR